MGYPSKKYGFVLKDKRTNEILETGDLWEENNKEARNYIKKQLNKDFLPYASIKIKKKD